MSIVLGLNLTERRPHTVTFVEPTWGDDAAWSSIPLPVVSGSLGNLTTRQPVQTVAFDVATEDLILEGTRTTAAALDVVAIPYATATTQATIRIQCGDSSNEAQGNRARDASGNNNFGVRNGETAFAQGKFGSGLTFGNADHANDYLQTSPDVASSGGVGTYMFWCNPSVLGDVARNIFEHNLSGNTDRSLEITTDRTLRVSTEESAAQLVAGYWSHVALVFGEGFEDLTLYIDGVLQFVEASVAPSVSGTGKINLGRQPGFATGFAGTLDDFRFYGRALTQAEVQAEMQSETPTIVDGSLDVHWPMNGYDSGVLTFGAGPNLASYVRRCAFHLLPYQLTCKVVRITISDPTNTASLKIGRVWIGPAYQPPSNFDFGFTFGRIDETKASRTPTGQLTTNSRVPVKVATFTIRHLTRNAVLRYLDELQRVYGSSRPLLICCDPDDDDYLEKLTIHGVMQDLSPFPWVYADGWEASFRVEEMP